MADPYFNNVVSLLNFEDMSNGTTVTDAIGARTWTAFGSATIASGVLVLDGANPCYIEQTHEAAIADAFDSEDFTIEYKADATYGGGGTFMPFYTWRIDQGGSTGIALYASEDDMLVDIGDATTPADVQLVGPTSLTNGQAYEVALTRSGDDFLLHVDGTYITKGTAAITLGLGTDGIGLGRFGKSDVGFMTGNVYRFRMTSGVARYSESNYTPEAGNSYAPPPTIISEPQSVSVAPLAFAQFSVTVEAACTEPTYQWYETTAGALSGETGRTLSLYPTLDMNGNSYYVIVTCSLGGTILSSTANLGVLEIRSEREALCWNFEDDNFTWFDAAHDTNATSSEYDPDAYYNAIIAIGADSLWVYDDIGTLTANDYISGDDLTFSSTSYTQDQGSFIDDSRRATLIGDPCAATTAIPYPSFQAHSFAVGWIGTINEALDTGVFFSRWSNTLKNACYIDITPTTVSIVIVDDAQIVQLSDDISGTYLSGDVFCFDLDMDVNGVYTYTLYQNFVSIATASGDLAGTYTLDATKYVEWGYQSNLTIQYAFFKSGGLDAGNIATLQLGYNQNFIGYSPTVGASTLDPVVCMKYQFDPGWAVRWSDLQNDNTTWDQLTADGTSWNDFYSGPAEENMYWLTKSAVLLSDQTVGKSGLKQYYVQREQIDFTEHVQEYRTDQWIYAKQFYFWLQSGISSTDENAFFARTGWMDSLMDDPDWQDYDQLNLQSKANSGVVKWDFRVTGRYLSMEYNFNATDEIDMVGGELDMEQTIGR